jgi:glutamine synthetase
MHDQVYSQELLISNKRNGYRDLLACIDLSTYRRIPWENDVPFFLVTFRDPDTRAALAVDPRGVVARAQRFSIQELGYLPYAGVEYEVSCHRV